MRSADNIKNLIKNTKIKTNPKVNRAVLDDLENRMDNAQGKYINTSQPNIWRIIMKSKMTKLAVATVLIIAAIIGINQFGGSVDVASVAFGEVLKNSDKVQSFHALLKKNNEEGEIWGKRGNKLRTEYGNGKYEISNGPMMWTVDEKSKKAVRETSWYFKDAQRKGVDVLDHFLRIQDSEGCSGFFAEEPIGQIEEEGRIFNLYKTELEQYGDKILFEAKVDAATNLLDYLKFEMVDDKGQSQIAELIILAYDEPIADKMFVYEPDEDMDVTIKEDEQPKQEIVQERDGARLSGQMVWAHSGKPVSGASLTIFGGKNIKGDDGKSRREYFDRTETDRDGYWSINGVPRSSVRISVRSWELNWPAVPIFTTNVGPAEHPRIIVDGKGIYENLDFEVYKPKDFFARITINVVDENGDPIEDVRGTLMYDEGGAMHGHVYASPRGKQFTGKDGRFDADNIWPTNRPVKLSFGTKGEFCKTYATRYVQTETFTIEPKGKYHFDVILPFIRQVQVQVLGTDGMAVEGMSVMAIDMNGTKVFPLHSSGLSAVLTDSNGMAEISGLEPGQEFLISVQRLDAVNPNPRKPVTSALFNAVAPSDFSKPLKQVIFDERPITIEGYCQAGLQADKGRVFLMLVGEPGVFTMSYLSELLDEENKFILEGVPAGHLRLMVRYVDRDGKYITVEGAIDTSTGNSYTVKVTDQQIEIIGNEAGQ